MKQMGRKRLSLFLGLFLFVSGIQSRPVPCHEDSMAQGRRGLSPDSVMESAGRLSLPADTSRFSRFQVALDNLGQTRLFRASYLGVPLVLGGLIEKHQDSKFRRLRNDFMPRFHRPLDNYTQFAPAAAVLALKLGGVPSRDSWGRMLASDAFTAVLMTGVVQGLKHSTRVERPDGSDNHSFPSGHTATAFMTATMLSKEYGHLSPWIGVGGYSVATATGLMRMANNKHWLSDVMVGAGVGILATELGYWMADAIFKDKGLSMRDAREERLEIRNPSFFGLYMGFNLPMSNFDVSEDVAYQTSTGTTVGVEGGYFLNRYIGVGGRATISNIQFVVNGKEAPGNTLDYHSVGFGPYVSLPLSVRWSVGTKFLLDYTKYARTDIGGVRVPGNGGWGFATGLGIGYRVRKHLGAGVFLDYNVQPPHSPNSGEFVHTATLGARAVIAF